MAKEAARCSALLRQMYALELNIWAMGENIADDMPERQGLKRRANAIFTEIREIVSSWRSVTAMAGWSIEEEKFVREICNYIDERGTKRY